MEILLRLLNFSLRKSIWPWNTSRMIFLMKTDKKSSDVPSSCRPLSIASHIGEVCQRMIERRLRRHVNRYNFLEEHQESFRSRRGTVRSLYRLHYETVQLKNSHSGAIVKTDLEKAFDSVWTNDLLYNLKS